MTKEVDFVEALKYVIRQQKKQEKQDKQWFTVRKPEFLGRLLGLTNAQAIKEFEFVLSSKTPITNVEYPVFIVTDNAVYSLHSYEKLCRYAQSGNVRFVRYKCGLYNMVFI